MKAETTILIIDDETAIRRFLRASLDESEFRLLEAADGREGLRLTATGKPDVVLLDLGLPDIDGTRVAIEIREWSEVPIIVLSAREHEQDKVKALDAGADDYITKPFGMAELLARIRVALRHSKKSPSEPIFRAGDLEVDLAAHVVRRAGEEVHLTRNEYGLLAALVKYAGKVVTHRQLLTEVWGGAYADESHYLRVYMGQLRHKLEADPTRPKLLTTEPGVGYRLKTE
ncbi:MAG TPA: response regulator [Fimbriimonadaceae bacterium]|nr:response regulator [Fimbriimonadaceae bacterium]